MMKKNKIIILILLIVFLMPKNVNAYSVTFGEIQTENNATSGPGAWEDGGPRKSVGISGYGSEYKCEYYINVSTSSSAIINAKNLKGEDLLAGEIPEISSANAVQAGTSIKLEILEEKNISNVYVEFAAYKEITEERCNENEWKCCPKNPITCNGNICTELASITFFNRIKQLVTSLPKCFSRYSKNDPSTEIETCSFQGCSNSETTKKYTNLNLNNNEEKKFYDACKSNVTSKLKERINNTINYNSYEAKLYDANEYNDESFETIEGKMHCPNNNYCQTEIGLKSSTTINGKYKTGIERIEYKPLKITYKYEPNKICINARTAKVKYLSDNEDACSQDELVVEKTDGYWNYFIPMKTKSDKDFLVSVHTKTQGNKEHTAKECEYVIENNKSNYYSIIKPKKGVLNGPEENETPQEQRERIESAKRQVREAGGCSLQLIVNIQTEQKFYNEVERPTADGQQKLVLEGFNFYYKPINPSNENAANIIFPNGVTKDENGDLTFNSLWSDWYKTQTTKGAASPDLSKSYNEVTYIAQNINISDVRKYNQLYAYTDWSNMNADGTSKFIDGVDGKIIIKRNNNLPSVYKLGCGPANITTQKGCGIK